MKYSIAIATRNRPEALLVSIPRMLVQSHAPSQLIIVDSSDNHSAVESAVREAIATFTIDLKLLQTEKGSSLQRNIALKHVKHPIVFFPDDDSIWYPEVAKTTMDVYENDRANKISAVCTSEAQTPPKDFLGDSSESYEMRNEDKFRRNLVWHRNRFEKLIAPDPFKIIGQSFISRFQPTDWQEKNNVVPVEWMTGFRMSFRTNVIKEVQFDESLGTYALNEDIDASFRSWRHGAVVAARNAKVYHHKFPARRTNGRQMGIITIMNRAYVTAKNTCPNDRSRKIMRRYFRFTLLKFFIGARGDYGRQRFRGALAAYRRISEFVTSMPSESTNIYLREIGQLLK